MQRDAESTIRSRDNPRVKALAALLGQKKERERSGRFVLEGVRLCLDALACGVRPESVYLTEQAMDKHPALAELLAATGQTVWLDEALAGRIADTKSTQGVFCVCVAPQLDESAVPVRADGRYLLLSEVQDPGNLGATLRTAAALGVDGAFLCGCAELLSPKALRASMGGALRLPVCVEEDMYARIAKLRAAGVAVYAAALQEDALTTQALRAAGECAVLIGNEGAGLDESLVAACDAPVCIDMRGGVDSLNAAVAAGILLWEMTRGEGA